MTAVDLGLTLQQHQAVAARGGAAWLREVILAELEPDSRPAEVVYFEFFGRPQGKKSGRAVRRGDKVSTHPAEGQQFSYAGIAGAFMAAKPGHWLPWPCAVTLQIGCYLRRPATWEPGHRCLKKPDWDNVGKLVGDALNGVAYIDDAQIDDARVQKAWTEGVERTFVRLEFWPVPAGQLLASAGGKALVKAQRLSPWVERWVTADSLDRLQTRMQRMA